MRSDEKRRGSRARPHRDGFTLVELVVAVSILLIICSLVLPAVQSSREASRRLQCANNQRQMIHAAQGFATASRKFPRASRMAWFTSGPYAGDTNQSSIQAELLPYLERAPLYNAINFDLPCSRLSDFALGNATAASQSIATFLCPSDPDSTSAPFGPNNYRANIGPGGFHRGRVPGSNVQAWMSDDAGAFAYFSRAGDFADFSDGLSNTVAFSEKPVGTYGAGRYNPRRDWIKVDVFVGSPEEWTALCANLPAAQTADAEFDAGRTWLLSGAIYTSFYTSAPPNSPIPDCGMRSGGGLGVFAARSFHPGGVNAAMVDGSVRWVQSTIAPRLWAGLGTRNRGD